VLLDAAHEDRIRTEEREFDAIGLATACIRFV
jgi:hypothetical protein